MIVAEQKPLEEILESIGKAQRVLIVGCRGCVTVCSAGGEKEVEMLAKLLELAGRKKGQPIKATTMMLERQCDPEFLDEVKKRGLEKENDVLLSMACGAGVQLVAETLETQPVLPALNTLFIGASEAAGSWVERCQACGDCKLHLTAGICPVSRCSKSMLNGPCGGSSQGHCELNEEVPCGWQLIIDRLDTVGLLEQYEKIIEPADWSQARDGGPRKVVREDLKKEV